MKWYDITLAIVAIFVDIIIYGKMRETMKNRHQSDSWRTSKK